MSLQKVHLRKLLQIMYLPDNKQIGQLRDDIRQEIRKASGENNGGGDFHTPFWSDVKDHIAKRGNITELSKIRISQNKSRLRLYTALSKGFLKWWDEKRRWQNEEFEFVPESVKVQFPIPELNSIVKIENTITLKIGDSYRIIYPYFSEEPILSEQAAKLGLWLLSEALPQYKLEDIRILDILRGNSFSIRDCPLQGSEGKVFKGKYKNLLDKWEELKQEY